MDWQRLISNKRFGQEERHELRTDDRSEFKRDYDRLIFSAPFRRMQNKTQVFPLPGSIFVHNRLTHSLEVASVGRSLGDDVARQLKRTHPELIGTPFEEIGTIVSTACLAHDMGNPPFGHSGEKAIQAYFSESSGEFLREKASIVKYPVSSNATNSEMHNKFGFFNTEADAYRKIAGELGITVKKENECFARHPLVFLVEAADDICYEIMDIEDAHKLKLLTFNETEELLLGFFDEDMRKMIRERIVQEGLEDNNEKVVYLRARVIGLLEAECAQAFVNHEEEILAGTFNGSLIDHTSPLVVDAYKRCIKVSKKKIYQSKPVLDVELSGYHIMETLMNKLIAAAVNPQKYHSQQLIHRFSNQYDILSDDLETRIMAVIDYISGMTDVYALDIYQKINGISLPIV